MFVLKQQSQQKTPADRSRSKKGKEPRSRVKKLKYHQYVPPDQKHEATELPMDTSYARLLQQQQLFLQLQILSQQQQHYNYQTILPAPLKYVVSVHFCHLHSLSSKLFYLKMSEKVPVNVFSDQGGQVVFNNNAVSDHINPSQDVVSPAWLGPVCTSALWLG